MSKFNGVKTENAKNSAKYKIRQNALLDCGNNARVLEVYCGPGEMYKKVWRNSGAYLGIDKDFFNDERDTIQGDALKTVSKINLSKYNIFDIDAYGEPYTVLNKIISKIGKAGEPLFFCVTDGVNMDLKMGRICQGLRTALGTDAKILKQAHKSHDKLIKLCINNYAEKLQADVNKIQLATGKTGSCMKYYYFMLSPKNVVESSAGYNIL